MEENILKSVREGKLEKQKQAVCTRSAQHQASQTNRDGQGTMKSHPSLRNFGD